MANTYTQLHIHIVFGVRNRQNIISDKFREDLHKYITGILQNKKCKMLCINSVSDHVHMLIGLSGDIALSKIIGEVKRCASNYINDKKFVVGKFNWQEGYSAFSVSHSHIDKVYNYIKNQQVHHKRKSFEEEYMDMLKKAEIDYDERYVFDRELTG